MTEPTDEPVLMHLLSTDEVADRLYPKPSRENPQTPLDELIRDGITAYGEYFSAIMDQHGIVFARLAVTGK